MNTGIERRLQRLEEPENEQGPDDLLERLEASRKRAAESIARLGWDGHNEAMRRQYEADALRLRAMAEDQDLPRAGRELARRMLAARLRVMATDADLAKAAQTPPMDGVVLTPVANLGC